jgi:hypothetical protein
VQMARAMWRLCRRIRACGVIADEAGMILVP